MIFGNDTSRSRVDTLPAIAMALVRRISRGRVITRLEMVAMEAEFWVQFLGRLVIKMLMLGVGVYGPKPHKVGFVLQAAVGPQRSG